MPSASADKRARQRANKRTAFESTSSSSDPVSASQTPETSQPTETINLPPPHPTPSSISSSPWPTPAPSSFTITYNPLSLSYPNPPDPAAKLPTDAVRVTRYELALMLRQSYYNGSEHGWKMHYATAKNYLQTAFESDMKKAQSEYSEHEKRLYEQAYNSGCEETRVELDAALVSIKKGIEEVYKKQYEDALVEAMERARVCSEDEAEDAFKRGHDAGVKDEHERIRRLI